jgi:hypothetical protein
MNLHVIFFGEDTSKICKYSFDKNTVFKEKSFQLDGNSEVEVYILNEKELLKVLIFQFTKVLF